jgi:hypothetical protein
MNASTRLTSAAVTGSMAWALMLMCLASCNSTFHGGKSVMSADFELAVKQASTAKPAEAASSRPKSSQCPSVLMFDGVDVSKDTIESKAKYWGEDVGVDGFFLNNVMASWEVTVPNDENSPDYVRLKHFQDLYARHGIDQNFIKISIYKPIDWKNATERDRDVDNFRRAAHLARFAGIPGIALDLESYAKGFWEVDPNDPAKPETIYQTGKAIGDAIEQAYPGSPVFVIREVLWWQHRAANYALSGRFWNGLMASSVPRLYMGEELTYDRFAVPDELAVMYRDDALHNHLDPKKVEIEPALWPLGKTYIDKAPRMTVEAFHQQLENAFAQHTRYVWIYGFGSAWETNGTYGKGPVATDFSKYAAALHRVKNDCAAQQKKR